MVEKSDRQKLNWQVSKVKVNSSGNGWPCVSSEVRYCEVQCSFCGIPATRARRETALRKNAGCCCPPEGKVVLRTAVKGKVEELFQMEGDSQNMTTSRNLCSWVGSPLQWLAKCEET